MPYTIVLTPPASQQTKYIEASQALCGDHQPSYLLNKEGSSSPHITVVQFDCEADLAHSIWLNMCAKMRTENVSPFSPPFVGVAFVEGTGPYQGTTWVELSVARGDKNSPIMKIHDAALEVLKSFNVEPLNAVGNNYRPHLTLGRIVMPKQMRTWSKDLCESYGNFNLEFGLSDEKWQYANSLATF